jgi:hypothetical protein
VISGLLEEALKRADKAIMVLTPVVRDAAVADVVPASRASTFGLDKTRNKRSTRVADLSCPGMLESSHSKGSFYATTGIF